MRYINPHFTYFTYLLTYVVHTLLPVLVYMERFTDGRYLLTVAAYIQASIKNRYILPFLSRSNLLTF